MTCRIRRACHNVSALAAIGLMSFTITRAAGQSLLIAHVNRTVVPVGETMLFSGAGLTNATQVLFHWAGWDFPAAFSPTSNGTLSVTMPSVRQDVREHYVSLRTPHASTLGLPPGVYYDNGPDTNDQASIVVVPAGQEFTLDMDKAAELIYVKAGGILNCPRLFLQTIYAEDGAVVDVSGQGEEPEFMGTLYLSPGVVLIGELPSEGMMVDVTVRPIPPVSLSPNIGYFYIGRALRVDVVGPGSVSRSPDLEYYRWNTLVQLTAHPHTNGVFSAWSGDVASVDTSVTHRIRENMNVTATFTSGWTLTGHVGDGGSVSVSPERTAYVQGEVVTLTAHPDPGHEFACWTHDASGTNLSTTVTMEGHIVYAAGFRAVIPDPVPLIAHVNRTVVPIGETILFSGAGLTNATQVLFHWAGWDFPAAFSPTSNGTLSVTMPSVRQDLREHYVSLRTPHASTVGLPPGVYYDNGPDTNDQAYIVVVPAGQEFTLDMDKAAELIYVKAGGILNCPRLFLQTIYAEDGAVVDVSGQGEEPEFMGTLYLSPGVVLIGELPSEGMMVDVTVRPIPPVSLSPNIGYFYIGFTLTVTNEGPGTASVVPEKTYYSYNETVTLTATPDDGCFFLRWIGSAQGLETPVSFRIKGNSAVTGRFARNPDYFRTWRPMYFTAEDLADTEISGPDGDPDGDGYTNAAEYLFGSHPRVPEDAHRIGLVRGGAGSSLMLSIQYVRPAWAADASYRIEVTQDFTTWHFNGDGTGILYSREADCEDIGDELERVTVALFPEGGLPDSSAFRVHATLLK